MLSKARVSRAGALWTGAAVGMVLSGCANNNASINQALALRPPTHVSGNGESIPLAPVLANSETAEDSADSAVSLVSHQLTKPPQLPVAEDSFSEIMAELQALGKQNPSAQARLLADLQKTPPGMLDHFWRHYRSATQHTAARVSVEPPTLASHAAAPVATPASFPTSPVPPVAVPPLLAAIAEREHWANHSNELRTHIELRLLQLTEGQTDAARRPLPRLAPPEQQAWQQTVSQLEGFLQGRPTATPAPQTALAEPPGPLTVQHLSFCRKISSFGVYTAFNTNKFHPGQEVLLYAELENYHSRSTPEGFRTELRSRYHILDAQGQTVAEQTFPVAHDLCRRPRRDYFHTYRFSMPSPATAGRYQLHLTVEDLNSGKIGQTDIPFDIEQP